MPEKFYKVSRLLALVGIVMILVGVILGYQQYGEYFATGRVIVGSSSDRGTYYGPKYYLIFPVLQVLAGIAFTLSPLWARIEVSEAGISKIDGLNRVRVLIPWSDVTFFGFEGKKSVTTPNGNSKIGNGYAVRSNSAEVKFDDSSRSCSALLAAIRKHISTSVEEITEASSAGK